MKITDAASFGLALRQRRKELHYTQAFLAEFSGFSVSFISDLENGKAQPSWERPCIWQAFWAWIAFWCRGVKQWKTYWSALN